MKKEFTGLFMSFIIIIVILLGVTIYGQSSNGTYVATEEALKDAITNAKKDETIILQNDIVIDDVIDITTEMILDLNGKTLKPAETESGETTSSLISVKEGASLTVAGNGIIQPTDNNTPAIDVKGGKITIESGTLIGNAVYVEEGNATINGGKFENNLQSRSISYPLYASEENLTNGKASIVVKGGSFQQYDPAGSQFEKSIYNFMADGYQSVYNEETGYYNVEIIENTFYVSGEHVLRKAINIAPENATIILQKDIELKRQISFTKSLNLDLNNKSLFTTKDICNNTIKEWSLISVQNGAEVNIIGNGSVIAANNKTAECYGIDVRENSKLTIENATVVGNCSAVYILLGEATINGGNYSINENDYIFEYRYTINCYDANLRNGSAKAIITGGTYKNFNPMASLSENPIHNFVKDGYRAIHNNKTNTYEVKPIANVNVTTEAELNDAIANYQPDQNIVLQNDIELTKQVTIKKSLTLDLNNKSLFTTKDICNNAIKEWSLISVQNGAEVNIIGNGSVIAANNKTAECYGIDVRENSKLTIENATVVGNCSAVYILLGEATINGGNYSINENDYIFEYRYTINCYDANLRNGSAKAIITGGTYKNFNPMASLSENPIHNFVKDGYHAIYDEASGFYNVSKIV